MEARKHTESNPQFTRTRQRFEELLGEVGSEEWRGISHSDVEAALVEGGRELMRELLEEWIALQAMAEVVEPVVGACKPSPTPVSPKESSHTG